MSARRKASCAKTRLHYGFVTPRRRTQRAGADLSSTVQPGSISNPFGSGLHLSRRRPATPAVNLSARTGAVPDRRTVVGGLQPPNDGMTHLVSAEPVCRHYDDPVDYRDICSRFPSNRASWSAAEAAMPNG